MDAARLPDASREASVADGSPREAARPPPLSLPLGIVVLTDEPVVSKSMARARFFNGTRASGDAGLARPVQVSAVDQMVTTPLAADVPPGHVSLASPANPAVDSLGYWEGAPPATLTPINLVVSPAGAVDAGADSGVVIPSWTLALTSSSAIDSFDLIMSSNHTGFLLGGGAGLTLLWCDDTTSSGSSLTSCATVQAPAP